MQLIILMTSKKRLRCSTADFCLPLAKRQKNFRKDEGLKEDVSRLNLRYNHDLCVDDFQRLAVSTSAVQHLDLTGCFSLAPEALPVITQHWGRSLLSLNLECCDNLVQNIHLTTPNTSHLALRSLNLSNSAVSDQGVRYFATRSPDLTHLNLQNCSNITDLSLSIVAQFSKKLKVLNVSGCPKITNFSLQILAQECNSHLEEINVNECRGISSDGGALFNYLAYFCPNLKRLMLRDTKVTGSELVRLCSKLQFSELNLQGLSTLTDDDLVSIAESQPYLEVLHLSFCYKVTLRGLQCLAARCPNLQELHLFGLNFGLRDLFQQPMCDEEESLVVEPPPCLKVFS